MNDFLRRLWAQVADFLTNRQPPDPRLTTTASPLDLLPTKPQLSTDKTALATPSPDAIVPNATVGAVATPSVPTTLPTAPFAGAPVTPNPPAAMATSPDTSSPVGGAATQGGTAVTKEMMTQQQLGVTPTTPTGTEIGATPTTPTGTEIGATPTTTTGTQKASTLVDSYHHAIRQLDHDLTAIGVILYGAVGLLAFGVIGFAFPLYRSIHHDRDFFIIRGLKFLISVLLALLIVFITYAARGPLGAALGLSTMATSVFGLLVGMASYLVIRLWLKRQLKKSTKAHQRKK